MFSLIRLLNEWKHKTLSSYTMLLILFTLSHRSMQVLITLYEPWIVVIYAFNKYIYIIYIYVYIYTYIYYIYIYLYILYIYTYIYYIYILIYIIYIYLYILYIYLYIYTPTTGLGNPI